MCRMLTPGADTEQDGLQTSSTDKITRRVRRTPDPPGQGGARVSIATLRLSSMTSMSLAIMGPAGAGATAALPRPGAARGAGLSSRVG